MVAQPHSDNALSEDQLYVLAGDAALFCGYKETASQLYLKAIELVTVPIQDGVAALIPDASPNIDDMQRMSGHSYSTEMRRRNLPAIVDLLKANFSEKDSRTTSIDKAVMQVMAL